MSGLSLMPTYEQTVRFEKRFSITAKNANEANNILDEKIDNVAWDADVEPQGHYLFEDDDVQCPTCLGDTEVDGHTCVTCNGDGSVPFPG